MLRRISVVAAPLLLAVQLATAGEPVSEGSRVRVTIAGELADDGSVTPGRGSHSIVGKLLAIDADYLSVTAKARTIRLPRATVTGLEISSGRSRGRGALIGAGIGVLVGLGWGAVEYSGCESQGQAWCDLALGIPVLTASVGAIVGLAIGRERWAEVSPTTFDLGVMPAAGGLQVVGTVRF